MHYLPLAQVPELYEVKTYFSIIFVPLFILHMVCAELLTVSKEPDLAYSQVELAQQYDFFFLLL